MTFCIKCGKELQDGAAFCHACGCPVNAQDQNQNQYQNQWNDNRNYYAPHYREKDTGITIILGVLLGLFGIMGVGQIYVGKAKRGALIMIAGFFLAFASYLLLFLYLTSDLFWSYDSYNNYVLNFRAVLAFAAVISFIHLIFFIWQAYDSYKLAKKYNQELYSTGKPPW